MNLKRFEIFIKLMRLTTSDQDGEALVALRKANAILMEANLDWEDLLRSKVTVRQTDQQPKPTGKVFNNANEINKMFEALFKKVPESSPFRSGFLNSLHEWWEDKGFLTEKQYNAVLKSYERI